LSFLGIVNERLRGGPMVYEYAAGQRV
jgi:hypothetical protein